jgi:hypothetical protein
MRYGQSGVTQVTAAESQAWSHRELHTSNTKFTNLVLNLHLVQLCTAVDLDLPVHIGPL